MVQEVINLGAFANDGTGDPLRIALTKTNNNFSRLFATVGSVDTYTTNTPGANLVLQPTYNANVLIGVGSTLVANATWFTGMTANNATFYGQITTSGVYPIIGNLSGTASTATVATTALYATTAGTAINAQNFTGNNLPNVNTIGNLIAANIAIANIGTLYSNSNIYASGNLTTSGYVTGNGYYLSGLNGITPSAYGNTNVAAYLTTYNGKVVASNVYGYLNGAVGANGANSGSFTTIVTTGNTTVGGNLYIGSALLYTPAYANLQYGGNDNSFFQFVAQNANNGSQATTDYVAVANNGSDTDTFIDFGITSSGYNQAAYNLTSANDGYLYVQGNTTTGGGNLVLSTYTLNDIVFSLAGGATANEIGRFRANTNSFVVSSTTAATNQTTGAVIVKGGMGVAGNVYATYFVGNGAALTGLYSNTQAASYLLGNISYGNISVNGVAASGNVSALYHIGNGAALTGLYGNSQASAYLGTYLPTYSGNLTAGNLVATGNVGGTFFIGNGSLLTGMYGNTQVASYLPSYSGNINAGNVNTTGNVNATYFVGSAQYLTGLYSNASVANYLPTYYTNANIAANGVSSTSYVLGYITINGYGFANLANTVSNTTTLYGNVSTMILDNTAGATVAVANIYLPANANLSDGTRITIGSNITVSSLRIIANDSSVSGNISSITPTTPTSWHYVKYAPYNGNPVPQQLPGGPRWIRVG